MHHFTRTIVVFAVAFLELGCFSKSSQVDEISTEGRKLPEMSEIEFGPDDWPWWRGPARDGKAVGDSFPTKWSNETNVAWKVKIPGRGHASPTVVGNNIFIATADETRKVQSVLCYDRKTGQRRWRKDVHQGKLGKLDHKDTTFASATVGCDGQRVFAVFRNNGEIVVTALDLAGEFLWQKNLGGHSTTWGFGASPVIYKELVIIAADSEGGGFIAAVNRKDGNVWWRKQRHKADDYSSAVVAEVAGKDQLLLSGGKQVTGYDPMTGDELWSVEAYEGTTCGTMVWHDDVAYVSSGFGGYQTVAVKTDGSKRVVWKNDRVGFYVASMLLHKGHLYSVKTHGGIVSCLDIANGEVSWKKRLGGDFYASPILAGGNIYLTDRRGKTTIFKPNPARFDQVATNRLGDETDATPIACGGQIFLRVAERSDGKRQEYLYCIGK